MKNGIKSVRSKLKKVLLLLLFLPTYLWALPNIGDKSIYLGTFSIDGIEKPYRSEVELIDYNPNSNQFHKRTTSVHADQDPIVKDEWVHRDSLFGEKEFKFIFEICLSEGGQLMNLTVSAGLFKSCQLSSENGDIWFGRVPFGILKMDVLGIIQDVQIRYKTQLLEFI